jgi:hypothetical protein
MPKATPFKPGMSDAAVEAKTGKNWPQWFALMDADGCASMPHKAIATHLHERHGVPDWWCQMVAVTYERARGLREKHQTPAGFQASASKTVDVPVACLFKAWADPRRRAKWLPGMKLVVRKSTPDKSMRITWPDPPSDVDVYFWVKGEAKSQVSLSHRKLVDVNAVAAMKVFWAGALRRMKETLAP